MSVLTLSLEPQVYTNVEKKRSINDTLVERYNHPLDLIERLERGQLNEFQRTPNTSGVRLKVGMLPS